MRSLLFVAALLAMQFVSAQPLTIDYGNDVKKLAPNAFKRTLSYNVGGEKNAALIITNLKGDIDKLAFFIDGAETPLTDPQVEKGDDKITVHLNELQDSEEHVLIGKLKKQPVIELSMKPGIIVNGIVTQGSGEEEAARADHWIQIENNLKVNFKSLYFTNRDGGRDTCTSSESTALKESDRIIYDALTGLTWFSNARGTVKVDHRHPIKLNANDPFVFQVKNVNPELYDVELADSSFLLFNESNPMIEKMLLGKSEGITLEGRKDSEKDNNARYMEVRAGLVLLNAEMAGLLENLRMHSRFQYNCVTERKHQALEMVDRFIQSDLGHDEFGNISFYGFVDIFLDPTSVVDSSLNRRLKTHYLELQVSKYELAYRFPHAPERDQINFRLQILRKANSPYPSLLTSKLPTQVAYVRNFFKVDVSAGLYYTNFRNEHYSIRADSMKIKHAGGEIDSAGNKLVKENNGRGEIGFASFVHFYQKWGPSVNIGAVVGAGISFEETPQPRYFTGLSLMLGRSNRICINGGWVWGNQQRLSNQYTQKADGSYNWLPADETSPKYIKKFQARGFLSISYNLPFLNRKPAEVAADPKKEAQAEE